MFLQENNFIRNRHNGTEKRKKGISKTIHTVLSRHDGSLHLYGCSSDHDLTSSRYDRHEWFYGNPISFIWRAQTFGSRRLRQNIYAIWHSRQETKTLWLYISISRNITRNRLLTRYTNAVLANNKCSNSTFGRYYWHRHLVRIKREKRSRLRLYGHKIPFAHEQYQLSRKYSHVSNGSDYAISNE